MRFLVLGDIHCRRVWTDIVAKEDCDKIIFLGDYLPPKIHLDDPTDACGCLYEILDYKDQYSDKVILLRGNHDMEALGYYWARCFPTVHPDVAKYCQTDDVKNWFLNNTQWIYQIPNSNIICSHAGIGNIFLDNVCKHLKYKKSWNFDMCAENELLTHLNEIEPCELFGYTPDRFSDDGTGDSICQPCTWIRPYSLSVASSNKFIDVVGHTTVNHVHKYINPFKDTNKEIWLCDALANKEYLIIEDNQFIPSKL